MPRKPVTVTLKFAGEWFIDYADDWKTALVVANNLMSMQVRLRDDWQLVIEGKEEPNQAAPL
jgi:hypothetical protein